MSAGDVRRAWDDLLAVLAAHAPVTHTAIRPPRPDVADVLERVERDLGTDLGDEVRAYFSLHGGSLDADVYPDGGLIDAERALSATQLTRRVWQDGRSAPPPPRPGTEAGEVVFTWHSRYLYYADDWCGGGGFIDLRDGFRRGCLRRWDKVDNDMADLHDGGPVASGFPELLTAVAEAIATGRGYPGRADEPNGEWSVRVVEGRVVWHGT